MVSVLGCSVVAAGVAVGCCSTGVEVGCSTVAGCSVTGEDEVSDANKASSLTVSVLKVSSIFGLPDCRVRWRGPHCREGRAAPDEAPASCAPYRGADE